MSKRFAMCGLGVFVLAFGAIAARAETVDEVSKAITEAAKKVKSISAKTHSEMEMSSPGYKTRRTGDGRFELLRKDDKVYMRNESKEVASTEAGGQVEKQEGTTLTIMDGEFLYSYTEMDGQKNAYKMKSDVNWDASPFEGVKETHQIEILPDETIDGAPVYVVKLTPKAPAGGAEGKMMQYFRKDCGYPVKLVSFDAEGKPAMTMTYSDIKLGEDIKPERFLFKAPEGIQVLDLTQMQGGAPTTAPTAEQKPEPAKPADQPKKEEPKKDEPKVKKPKLPKLP